MQRKDKEGRNSGQTGVILHEQAGYYIFIWTIVLSLQDSACLAPVRVWNHAATFWFAGRLLLDQLGHVIDDDTSAKTLH